MKVSFINPKLKKQIQSFGRSTTSKIIRMLDLLEQFGSKLGMPYSKKITENLFELRTRGHQEVRLLYCFYKRQAVILHIFVKKSSKIPLKEIKTAQERYKLLT